MPPDPRDWLGEDHLAWFVLESVERIDLSAFYASYRLDGWGRAAFEPEMMVALLLYAYARGERSSRGIERKCVEDVAYRVLTAQQTPDHSTIARFRVRHEESLAALFSDVLLLCKDLLAAFHARGRAGDRRTTSHSTEYYLLVLPYAGDTEGAGHDSVGRPTSAWHPCR